MKRECFTCNAEKETIKNQSKCICKRKGLRVSLHDEVCEEYQVDNFKLEIRKEMSNLAKGYLNDMKK